MMVNPSLMCISSWVLTKIRGNNPVVKVITALNRSGEKAESKSYSTDTTTLRNMNSALKRSAIPIFLETTLIFIT
jgi:hypothetical protein